MSDRWPVVKHLAAWVWVRLANSFAQLRRAAAAAAANSPEEVQDSHEPQGHPRTRAEQRAPPARQAERRARYEPIAALQTQGMKRIEMAAVRGMAERTVREWLSRGDGPSAGPRKPRAGLLDPSKT